MFTPTMSPSLVMKDYGLLEDLHPDPHNLAFFNFFYQGIANMIPWNILIFANRYFEIRLSNVPAAENFIYYFTLIFMMIKFIFLVSGMRLSTCVKEEIQLLWTIAFSAIVFATIGILCGWDLVSDVTFYYCILVLVLMAALGSALVEAGFLSVLTYFPAKYTQAYLLGSGFAGLISALLHIFTSLGSSSAVSSTFASIYFGVATLIILASLVLIYLMFPLRVYRYYRKKSSSIRSAREVSDKAAVDAGKDAGAVLNLTSWEVLGKIYDLAGTVFLLTTVNLIISPMLIVSTRSTRYQDTINVSGDRDLFHSIAFLLNSLADLVSKTFPLFSILSPKKLPFLLCALGRVIFIPILLLGNVFIMGKHLPFFAYANDYIFMGAIVIKAMTGSYLGTLSLMWAPQRVEAPDRGKAVTLMVYSGGAGLVVGSLLALGVKHILLKLVS